METPWNSMRPRARILPGARPRRARRGPTTPGRRRAACRRARRRGRATADCIRSAARDAGRDEGLAYAQRLLVEIQQARVRTLEGEALRQSVSELALAVARRVLGDAWEADPLTWARAVLTAAEPVRRAARLSLRVAPASAATARHGLAAEVRAGAVDVVEDPTVDEAGCIAVSSCGSCGRRLSTMSASFRGPLGLEEPGCSEEPLLDAVRSVHPFRVTGRVERSVGSCSRPRCQARGWGRWR